MSASRDIGGRRLGYVLMWTVGGTTTATVISMAVTYYFILPFGPDVMRTSLWLSFVLPIVLAVPSFTYIGVKLQELSQANRRLRIAVRTDGLTTCLNRTAFTADVTQFIGTAGGESRSCALLILDVDHFKQINDRHGHLVGDKTLVEIAARIRNCLRPADAVGRLGGEEFGIFLDNVDMPRALAVAERIRLAIQNDVNLITMNDHAVTVSIGGTLVIRPADYTEAFKLADLELYRAKNGGRNQVHLTPLAPHMTTVADVDIGAQRAIA